MPKPKASDRVSRLLSLIPWIVANPGENVSAISTRFGLSERELLDDLSVVHMIGLPPYTPDSLIDVDIAEDGCVFIRLADYFSRPLRLTPGQGLAILTSSEAILSSSASPNEVLSQALQKLEKVLGIEREKVMEVTLGDVDKELLEKIKSCISTNTEAEILYYSYGRDTYTKRKVVPWKVLADVGHWYLHAWCFEANDERLFRLDRIDSFHSLNSVAKKSAKPLKSVFTSRAEDPRVTFTLSEKSMWVLEAYPYDKMSCNDDGSVEITLAVTAEPWLERLLMQLGSDIEVVSSQGIAAKEIARETSRKILRRYRG